MPAVCCFRLNLSIPTMDTANLASLLYKCSVSLPDFFWNPNLNQTKVSTWKPEQNSKFFKNRMKTARILELMM